MEYALTEDDVYALIDEGISKLMLTSFRLTLDKLAEVITFQLVCSAINEVEETLKNDMKKGSREMAQLASVMFRSIIDRDWPFKNITISFGGDPFSYVDNKQYDVFLTFRISRNDSNFSQTMSIKSTIDFGEDN